MDKRKWVQALFAFTTNSSVQGFFSGKIYREKLKDMCVPGLNCYSCPGAFGVCPIDAMQAVEGSMRYGVSMCVLGFLIFVGILPGRFVCGWLCPFGWIQELLYRISSPKRKVPKRVNNILKWLKHGIPLVFVTLLPTLTVNGFGLSAPYFCKYICPADTLEGGAPPLLVNKSLRSAVGLLFMRKMAILIAVIVASVLIFCPFCRYLCPLGAFYSLFNPIGFYRCLVNRVKCTRCKRCAKACKMDVDVFQTPNSLECIRCGECVKTCPEQAISCGFGKEKSNQTKRVQSE